MTTSTTLLQQALDERLKRAYALGWMNAASWAKRDDLLEDIGSPAYLDDMTDAMQVFSAAQPAPAPRPDEFVCPYCFDQPAPAVEPVPSDMAALIQRTRDAAHWQLIEGNGDDETHRALNAAADGLERLIAAPSAPVPVALTPLTEEQINALFEQAVNDCQGGNGNVLALFARAVLAAAHGITGGQHG